MTSHELTTLVRFQTSQWLTTAKNVLRGQPAWTRLGQFDVPEWLSPIFPVYVSQILFALICACVAILLRLITNLWLPGAGPFALTVPTVLVATLFGRWFSGVVCLTISSLYAWYHVLPMPESFSFAVASDGPRVAVNIASGFFVVALAELFRNSMRQALRDREMLLLELEHRVKNNFASVSAMLRLQIRAASDEATEAALQSALGRVESYARANSSLYRGHHYTGTVEMRSYLQELCRSLELSFGTGTNIRVRFEAASAHIPRDRAIILGLLVNEVATNSVKHAFDDKRQGVIDVRFSQEENHYRLIVSDNGSGIADEKRDGALGMKLIHALSTQANGTFEINSTQDGTAYRFEFAL